MTAANNNPGGSISGISSDSAGVLTLTLNGPATAAQYEQALQSITYEDSNTNPTAGSRSLSLTVTDSQLNSASTGYTINVIGTNSSLAVVAPASESLDQDGSMMFAWSSGDPISVADPSFSGGTDSMKLSVNNGSLYLGTSAGPATSSGNGTASISMSGNLAALDAALDGLEYFPGAEYVNSDTLSASITGSAGLKATANVNLFMSPAPSFSLGPDQTIPIGVGGQTVPGWASGMTAGLQDDSDATLKFIVSNDTDPSLFSAGPSIDPDGDLTYTPAPGANGSATISVELQATPTGGALTTSAPSEFTITLGADVQPQLVTPPSELIPADSEMYFGSASADGIYIAGDTDTGAQVTVTISTDTDTGWINIGDDTACTITNDNSSMVTLTGSIADVNGDLASLNLNPNDPGISNAGSGTVTVSLTWASGGTETGAGPITNVIPLTIVDPTTAASTDISISLPTDQAVPAGEWLTFGSATGNPITINADPTAEAEVTLSVDSAQSVDWDNQLTLGSTDGLTMIDGSGDGENVETFTGTVADINAALDGLEFSTPYAELQPFTVVATLLDNCGQAMGDPAAASTTITVRSAPSFNSYLGLWLDDQPQYSGALYSATSYTPVYGTSVADVLNPVLDTEDGVSGSGIAITGLDSADGTWQFSTDGGNDWSDINAGAISDTSALLLDSLDSIRLQPTAGYVGDISDAVTFRLWDETSGAATDHVDASDNGGTTAFSATTATAALRIDPVPTVPTGALLGSPLTATFASDGSTLQVSFSPPMQPDLVWATADGTAEAGSDYQRESGSISAGQNPTLDIPITNFNGDGTLSFYIVATPNNSSTSTYYPVTIPVTTQLLADSNNDGRIDATEDVAANQAAISSNSGGVLVSPDPDNDPTSNQPDEPGYDPSNYGQALVASGRLVEVDLAINYLSAYQSGATFTLTAQGDTTDFVVWADPGRTEQINVTGGSVPWTADTVPSSVWVEAPIELTAGGTAPAIILSLAMQNPSGSPQPASKVKVQAVATPTLQAMMVKDDSTSSNFNTAAGMLPTGQTAYVPLDNDYDANSPTKTDLQVYAQTKQLSSAEDDLLPIVITGVAGQGGYYTINGQWSGELRIWLPTNPSAPNDKSQYKPINNSTPLYLGANGTLTLYVEGIAMDTSPPTITAVWHGTGAKANVAPPSQPLTIAVFEISGPRSVPENTTYSYQAKGGSDTGVFLDKVAGPGSPDATTDNVNANAIDTISVTWGSGPRFGKLDYMASPNYTWAADVAIVDIQFNLQNSQLFTAVNAPAGQQSDPGPSQVDGTNRIDSISSWKNNPNAAPAAIPPAMTGTIDVSKIIGPTRQLVKFVNGANVASTAMYGIQNINIGFIQTVVASIPGTTIPAGTPILDKLTNVLTPGSTYNNFRNSPVPQATLNMGPWEDAGNQTWKPAQWAYAQANNASNLAVGKFGAFLSGQQAGNPPVGGFQNVYLAVTDTPSRWPLQNGFNAISATFTLQVAVSIAGQGVGALAANKGKYWSEVSGTWNVTYVGNYVNGIWTPNIPESSQVTIQSPFSISPPATPITIPSGPVFNAYLR